MLSKILDHKRTEIARMRPLTMNDRTIPIRPVLDSLQTKSFICEIKRASPSHGIIDEEVDIIAKAKSYAELGAGMISVLTDEKFFAGSFDFLQDIAKNVEIPVLCKDFILSEVQIDYAYHYGASAILLIVRALEKWELEALTEHARSLGLGILFELNSIDEYSKIAHLNPELVGVNSRDLATLRIDKERAKELLKLLPRNLFLVAESGINTGLDVREFYQAGARGFLVGTSLMRAKDGESLSNLFLDLQRGCQIEFE
jgi:indole-3-glycerol phosphate synthase